MSKNKNIIDLNTFASGELAHKVNKEVQKVLQNIADPNTEPKTKRKIAINITLQGDEQRDIIGASVTVKSTLAPEKDVESKIMLDYDDKGKATGAELKSGVKGQTYLDYEDNTLKDDRGENIVDFRENKKEEVK